MSSSFEVVFYCVIILMAGTFASENLLGGKQDIDLSTNADAQRALSYAVRQYNALSNDTYRSKVAQVLGAQSQVVEGVAYTFHVIMARTNCAKNSVKGVCTIQQGPEGRQECTFTVWQRPWLNSNIATEKCKNQ